MITLLLAACLPLSGDAERITAADLAAAEPGFSALPPDARLGYAPAARAHRIFSVPELERLARRYDLPFVPRAEICFEPAVEVLSPASLLDAIRSSLGLAEARIEIIDHSRYPAPHGSIEFPPGGLVRPPPSQPQAAVLWRGSVHYGGNRRFPIWAKVRILVRAERVVACRPLVAGRPVEAAQLRLEIVQGFPPRTAFLTSIEQAAGRVPRRSIAAGTPLSAADLDAPCEVMRGDAVRVVVSSGEARLVLDGLAEASGRRGQTIPVRNPANGKRFQARVEGAGKVEVGVQP